jgi:hypothetical protein
VGQIRIGLENYAVYRAMTDPDLPEPMAVADAVMRQRMEFESTRKRNAAPLVFDSGQTVGGSSDRGGNMGAWTSPRSRPSS